MPIIDRDEFGRKIFVQMSGNPDHTTQWDTRGDDVSGNKRNAGKSSFWNTGDGLDEIDESKALLDTGDGYRENAKNNLVFDGQVPIEFYGAGFKRKRIRQKFIDSFTLKNGFVSWLNGAGNKTFFHAFVFLNNILGVKPDRTPCTVFNASLPHDSATNPVGWLLFAYVAEFPMLGSCTNGVYFEPERTSDKLLTGNEYGNAIEAWTEISWLPSATAGNECQGFSMMMTYAPKSISNGF